MKNVFWGRIDESEYALRIVKSAGAVLVVLGGLTFLLFLVGLIGAVSWELFAAAVVLLVLGVSLYFFHSRLIALLFGGFWSLVAFYILQDMIIRGNFEGNNLLIPMHLAFAWLGIRAFQASWYLKRNGM